LIEPIMEEMPTMIRLTFQRVCPQSTPV